MLKSSRRSPSVQSCGREVVYDEACFLSCFILPLQSPTAGRGDFEILSILEPLEWYISQARLVAKKKISYSKGRADFFGGRGGGFVMMSDVLRNISFVKVLRHVERSWELAVCFIAQ